MPTCLAEAYQHIESERAWVACLVRGDTVQTVASTEKMVDVLRSPGACFALPTCPKDQRVPFLLGGVVGLERNLV